MTQIFLLVAGIWISTILLIMEPTSAGNLNASDFFKICSKSDSRLNACAEKSINDIRDALKKGIPELKILSLEPMVVPKVTVRQGSGPVSIDSTFHNLHVKGVTNYEITSVNVQPETYRIDVAVTIPYLYMYGDYEIRGRILILPITGNGDSWSNYTGVSGRASLIGHPVTREGEEYLELDDFKFDVAVKKAVIHMNNLFNGNKELGDAMNRFMSENWEVVFSELKPVVDEAIGTLLKDVARKVFDKFPYNQLFAD